MRPFIQDDFILTNETAKTLFHQYAEKMPILDYHNHLDAREIYENRCYDNLTEVWLSGDHYKWRAMRANGVPEYLITGDGDPYEKFLAWADTVENAIGNPLYHWTHLELMRYFHIEETLSKATAPAIWKRANELLRTPDFSIQNLLKMQQVRVLCTTDDPVDDLTYHRLLKESDFAIKVLPTFRPELALGIEKDDFCDYIQKLGAKVGLSITSIEDVLTALAKRLDFFIELGCVISDHSLECLFYTGSDITKANDALLRCLKGETLSLQEEADYRGFLLSELGQLYAKKNIAMQLHIGALRSTSTRMFEKIGANTGYDSVADFNYAPQLAALLDSMDRCDALPKTILYYLNPKDADMLSAMAGNFQGNEQGIRGKIQLGAAWWFCDHKAGMERQMEALCDNGLISTFIGMLTDSRSFLSFPRHEYFRRILCNKIGSLVENGEYPGDLTYLGTLVENICYNNADTYLFS